MEGRALFDLSQLLAYRAGDFSPAAVLTDLDADVQEMVMHMIQRSPSATPLPPQPPAIPPRCPSYERTHRSRKGRSHSALSE